MNTTLLWFPVFQNRVLFASVFQIPIYRWLLSDYLFLISSGTIDCFKDCEGNLHWFFLFVSLEFRKLDVYTLSIGQCAVLIISGLGGGPLTLS
jgi:hypothetical protein